ncbi:hypothetical protein [Ruegeria sp. EL01]|jgi:hypothetical protein|uniref:hypothetical protein n=1 Tax=Ruegeria sp. EL01 TaxID=2107578 RepID=UPI0013C4153D|nr:hypothetical protein [Ruegeria sp. EL01]
MKKTAIGVETQHPPKGTHSSNTRARSDELSSAKASSGRFPSIENALTKIAHSIQLYEASKDV